MPHQQPPTARNVAAVGDYLYRASDCAASRRLEHALWQPGVIAFYDDPFFECLFQEALYQRHGIPIPRTIQAWLDEPAAMQAQVARVGGFPFLIKRPREGQGAAHIKAHRLVVVGHRLAAAGVRLPDAAWARQNAWV